MSYTMFLNKIQFPVMPGKLRLRIKGKNRTMTLVNDGEINFLKLPGLTEISFDVLLPMRTAYYAPDARPPDYYLGELEQMASSLAPVRWIISRVDPRGWRLYDNNMSMSLESYDVTEDADNGSDVVVSLTLKQYKDFGTKTVQLLSTPEAPLAAMVENPREQSGAPKIQTYTVVSGDTLWAIAKRAYGDGAQYPKIAEANKVSNPNLIYPGQELTIPA